MNRIRFLSQLLCVVEISYVIRAYCTFYKIVAKAFSLHLLCELNGVRVEA